MPISARNHALFEHAVDDAHAERLVGFAQSRPTSLPLQKLDQESLQVEARSIVAAIT